MRRILKLDIFLTLSFILMASFFAAEIAFAQDDNMAVRGAVEKSLPLLQTIGPPFIENTGCISCHHNALPAMAVAVARERNFKVNERLARQNIDAVVAKLSSFREKFFQGTGIPGDATTTSYSLLALGVNKQPANTTTDAMVHYLLAKQSRDGRWQPVSYRPPIEYSDISATALTLRAVQLYASKGLAEEVAMRTERARSWLATASPKTTEERTFHLLGLVWAKASKKEIEKAGKALLAEQRADGGWSQLSVLESDAYATGQALTALHQAGSLGVTNPAYQRGVKFLLKTQRNDGSWFVETRAIPLQRQFDSGFPYGKNQWISAAATSWATMALALSVAPVGSTATATAAIEKRK